MAPKDRKSKKGGSKGGADDVDALAAGMKAAAIVDNGRSCTGVLSSHPESRDVLITSFTLLYHGHQLLVDAELQLNFGRWDPCSLHDCMAALCRLFALCFAWLHGTSVLCVRMAALLLHGLPATQSYLPHMRVNAAACAMWRSFAGIYASGVRRQPMRCLP